MACSFNEGFFFNSLTMTCHYCAGFEGTTGKANSAGCICVFGIWNPFLMQCTDFTCGDIAIYVAEKNKCLCNPIQYVELPGDLGCFNCKNLFRGTGAVAYNSTNDKFECVCQPNFVWELTAETGLCNCGYPLLTDGNGGCICDETVSISIGVNQCIDCRQIPGSTG